MFDEDQPDENDSRATFTEPDPEPDPEADLPDPESELPSVPSVAIPSPSATEGDASPELLRGFWGTVLVINVALLATSVGAMMVAFDVERRFGLALVAVGVLSALRGYRKYRVLDERHRRGELTEVTGETRPDAPATTDERNG